MHYALCMLFTCIALCSAYCRLCSLYTVCKVYQTILRPTVLHKNDLSNLHSSQKNSALCPGVATTSGKCQLAAYYSLNFKWKGGVNNFDIRKYTADACVGLARLPKSWVLRRRGGRLRQSWPRISSWETRCLSELVLRVMPRTFHLLLGPARIPSGTDCTLVGRVQSAHKSTR